MKPPTALLLTLALLSACGSTPPTTPSAGQAPVTGTPGSRTPTTPPAAAKPSLTLRVGGVPVAKVTVTLGPKTVFAGEVASDAPKVLVGLDPGQYKVMVADIAGYSAPNMATVDLGNDSVDLKLTFVAAGQPAPDPVATPKPAPQPSPPTPPTTPPSAPPTTPPVAPPGASSSKWSDAATWPGGKVPAQGDSVTIPAGKEVLLDVSPPRLAGLTVEGTLRFAELDLELQSDWIMLHGGKLQVGSEAQPFAHQARITLTDVKAGEDVMGMGDKVLGIMAGGQLDLHGQPRLAWTRLAGSVRAGATSLTLAEAPDWRAGDQIILASTDFDHGQAQTLTVRSVAGKTVTFGEALKWPHYGEVQTIAGRTLDERAEVGLLSRNVVVSGEEQSSAGGFGGHVMVMDGGQARFENVELTRMGQAGVLKRYPIHYHLLGSAASSYVRGSSLHDLFNRCLTIHGTNDLRVDRNVMANTVGHCLFLEDGIETGNQITNNLVLGTRKPDTGKGQRAVLPSDDGFPGAASYWITNPNNTLTGNVAAGGDGNGFWYALPEHPTGPSANAGLWPQRTALGKFADNVAHSYGVDGLHVDRGPNPDGSVGKMYYAPRSNPSDEKSAPVPAIFERFSAFKNRDRGTWLRGSNLTLNDATLADNAIGATFAADQTGIEGGLVAGESANTGTPQPWEKTGEAGRSLPRPWEADFPIRGFEFYDGQVWAKGTAFANYSPNATRQASALGYLTKNHFSLSPKNSAQALSFTNANRVYLPDPAADRDGDKSAVFVDLDGSVTGQAGQVVTANAPLLHDASCAAKTEWNAYLCALPYARLWADEVNSSGAGALTIGRADGASVTLNGTPDDPGYHSTSLPVGASYSGSFAQAAPARLRVAIDDRAPGDWLRLSLPYGSEPSLYRDWWVDNRNKLKKVALADLDASQGDSYAYEGGKLHLKLVVKKDLDWAELEICQNDLCK